MPNVYKDWVRFSWNRPKQIAENKIAFVSPNPAVLSRSIFLKTSSSNTGASMRTMINPPILPVEIIPDIWSVGVWVPAGESMFMPIPIMFATLEKAYMMKNSCKIVPKSILLPGWRLNGIARTMSQNAMTPITLGTYISRNAPVGVITLTSCLSDQHLCNKCQAYYQIRFFGSKWCHTVFHNSSSEKLIIPPTCRPAFPVISIAPGRRQ